MLAWCGRNLWQCIREGSVRAKLWSPFTLIVLGGVGGCSRPRPQVRALTMDIC